MDLHSNEPTGSSQQIPDETAHPDQAGHNNGKSSIAAELWDWIKSFAIAIVIVLLVHTFVFNLSTVRGDSMRPTLEEGEWLFVNKFNYVIGQPKHGDVVILKDPSRTIDKKDFLVKRIVAVPGDTVEAREHHLYVNSERVEETYTDIAFEDMDFDPVIVRPGHYFVIGDNRRAGASRDSRSFGTVPEAMIKGQATFILWPMSKWRGL